MSLPYQAEQINAPDFRLYRIRRAGQADLFLPSVTTILKHTGDPSALDRWRERVGEEAAARISLEATTRGTDLHDALDRYLNGDRQALPVDPQNIPWWNSMATILPKIGRTYYREHYVFYHSSTCPGYCGALDRVVDWEGLPTLCDWKNSLKHKSEQYIQDYIMQVTAYIPALEQSTGMRVDHSKVVIMLAGWDAQVFSYDRNHMRSYWKEWRERVEFFHEKMKDKMQEIIEQLKIKK